MPPPHIVCSIRDRSGEVLMIEYPPTHPRYEVAIFHADSQEFQRVCLTDRLDLAVFMFQKAAAKAIVASPRYGERVDNLDPDGRLGAIDINAPAKENLRAIAPASESGG